MNWLWCLIVITGSLCYFVGDVVYWLYSGPKEISGWSNLTRDMTWEEKAGLNLVISTLSSHYDDYTYAKFFDIFSDLASPTTARTSTTDLEQPQNMEMGPMPSTSNVPQ